MMNHLNDKIILVTGASRGLGNKVVQELIDRGAKVIAVARNIELLQQLDDYAKTKGSSIVMTQLDLNDFNKIDELGYNLYQKFGKLDGLVSCAAMFGVLSPIPHISLDVWRKTMSLNLEANWRMIRSMDALLRASNKPASAVFVSAPVAKQHTPYYGAYAISKAALEALVNIYNNELVSTSVSAKIFTPPPMATDMRRQEFPGLEGENLTDIKEIAKMLVDYAFSAQEVLL
jgi:NAD(P)-dependent dehydrogenase (short-subunit alcohol dehydrogenase family)